MPNVLRIEPLREQADDEIHVSSCDLAPMPRKLALTCKACGKSDRYDVGAVLVSDEFLSEHLVPRAERQADELLAHLDDYLAFSAYFRCRSCDAAGPWRLSADARFRVLESLALLAVDPDGNHGVHIGESALFDGTRTRSPAEAEDVLRARIAQNPERAFLWVRLGNALKNGGVPKFARDPYERALELDPYDVEAHAMLGQCLEELHLPRQALEHHLAVLTHIRRPSPLTRETRLELVSAALDRALALADDPNEVFRTLPMGGPDAAERSSEPRILVPQSWDLSRPRDWEQVCRLFVDGHIEPPRFRGLSQPKKPRRRRHRARR